MTGALRVGIGGPVGSGKTALIARLCRALTDLSLAVTSDIYTTEDADFLRRHAVLPDERIVAVATGCCPHTAVRDDIAAKRTVLSRLRSDPPLVLRRTGTESVHLVSVGAGPLGGDDLACAVRRRAG